MKKNLKIIVGILIVVVVLGGGYGVLRQRNLNNQSVSSSVEQSKLISYDGEDGKTAYDILQSKYSVEASTGSYGVMVSSINGLKATSTEFWLYSVNGEQPDKAADQFMTRSGDKITWEYKGM